MWTRTHLTELQMQVYLEERFTYLYSLPMFKHAKSLRSSNYLMARQIKAVNTRGKIHLT